MSIQLKMDNLLDTMKNTNDLFCESLAQSACPSVQDTLPSDNGLLQAVHFIAREFTDIPVYGMLRVPLVEAVVFDNVSEGGFSVIQVLKTVDGSSFSSREKL